MLSRREFVRRTSFALVPIAMAGRAAQDTGKVQGRPPNAGGAPGDTLAGEYPVGRPSAPMGPLDNDPGVIAIERRLRCTCGCTLDVYTCRTTDFSCTFSPAMHRDVVLRVQRHEPPEQVIQWFVAQNGEKVLMAPEARGFNLMGYLVPGLTVSAFGLALAAWLMRRRSHGAVAQAALVKRPGTAPSAPDAAELERLRRALDDVES